jgi:deazaflavin-dependent oxidoreductase (nitroreductase family)
MNDDIARALEWDCTIDIITMRRKTGRPRRTEIWFHNIEGRLYITGTPGRRDWYANLLAHPEFTFCLKESVRAGFSVTARPIPDDAQHREIFAKIHRKLEATRDLEAWVVGSPLVEVTLGLRS